MSEWAFDGIEQGRMQLEQVVRLLKDVDAAVDMVGLTIAEHLPWDMLRLKNSLAVLTITKSCTSRWAETAPPFPAIAYTPSVKHNSALCTCCLHLLVDATTRPAH